MTQQWKLVPVEPTEEQVKACSHNDHGGLVTAWYRRAIYAAMLAAAPTPPASAQPESMREGYPHDDPQFIALCREHDILGTAMQGLAAVFWRAASAQDDAKDERQAFEAWMASQNLGFLRDGDSYSLTYARRAWDAWQARSRMAAPAAGDARDAARLDWLEQHDGRFYNKDRISSIVGVGFLVAGDTQGVRHPTVRAAIDAAIAASQQQEG